MTLDWKVIAFALFGVGLSGCASVPDKNAGNKTTADNGVVVLAPYELPDPRPHHYAFAHKAVPQIFFANTDALFMRLRTDPSEEIRRLWEFSGRLLKKSDHLGADGLKADYQEAAGVRMVMITMPEAQVSPEAIFVVLAIRGRDRFYITYEQTFPDSNEAILCGWDNKGGHLNYGIVGDRSRETFEKILTLFLAKTPEPDVLSRSGSG